MCVCVFECVHRLFIYLIVFYLSFRYFIICVVVAVFIFICMNVFFFIIVIPIVIVVVFISLARAIACGRRSGFADFIGLLP